MDVEVLAAGFTLFGVVAGAGVAWGSARNRISTVEEVTDDIVEALDEHKKEDVKQHTEIVQRLTRIETVLTQINKKL